MAKLVRVIVTALAMVAGPVAASLVESPPSPRAQYSVLRLRGSIAPSSDFQLRGSIAFNSDLRLRGSIR